MYIKRNMTDAEGFSLNITSISNTSTSKTKIVLPYNGPLPADLRDTTSADIVIMLQVGLTVNILLTVERDGKKHRYPVKATPEEIDSILQPFFFDADGKTRHDTGLERYSLGLYQGTFINWKRLTMDENGIDNILPHLSPAAVKRVLQHIRHSESA